MDWLTLALISVAALSVSNLLQRVLMKDEESDPVAYSVVFQFLCAGLVALLALRNGFVMPRVEALPLNFLFLTVFYGLGSLFFFKALKTTEVSNVTILMSSRALWVILLSVYFIGEHFDFSKAAGTLLILVAVVLVSKRSMSISSNQGTIYALMAALFWGAAFTNDAYVIKSIKPDIISYTSIAFFLPGVFILLTDPKKILNAKNFLKAPAMLKMALVGILYSTVAISAYLAYQFGGNASQLGPIFQSQVILTVILAAVFLGERDNLPTKFIGTVLIIMGVILIR